MPTIQLPADKANIENNQTRFDFSFLFAPIDLSSIIAFRIFFGVVMIYHVYAMLFKDWVTPLYITPEMHFTYPGFGWVRPWPGQGMIVHFHVMGIAAVGMLLGFCYRLSILILAIGMLHVFLIEKAFYLNHYYLITLLCFLMVVIPAHRSLSVDAWLWPQIRSQVCPRWCLWLLRIQVGIPYVYGGIAKFEPDWLQGYPLGMWLERNRDLFWMQWLPDSDWVPLVFSYSGLLLDLLVVPCLLWKPTRIPALLLATLFHLMNSTLFDIGIFPWLMTGASFLYFSPDWPRKLLGRAAVPTDIISNFRIPSPSGQTVILSLLGVYLSWQLLFPFRCLLYPGRAVWTEEGHHFAWHMMLREKDVGIRFYIRDPATGTGGVVDVQSFLSSRQLSRMAKDSDMILTFVHFLRDHYRSHGKGTLQIRVLALASLNGRKPQLLLDPELDYAQVERTFFPQSWIMPLTEPLRKVPFDVPLNEWESVIDCPSPEQMVQKSPSLQRDLY